MKYSLILLLPFIVLYSACRQNPKIQLHQNANASYKKLSGPQHECYSYVKNRDTVSLSLNVVNKILTGNLSYNFFEKDKSKGKVSGEMKGDTLLLNYTFEAEGTTSVRQVAYLKKDQQLLEGYGDVEEKNGNMVFKNLRELKYGPEGVVLKKISCE
jgi:hypothetical protein